MRKGLTELVLILDRSYSMNRVWADAVNGIKSFITEQKKVPGEAKLTLVLFDEPPFDVVYERINIRDANPAKLDSFQPRANTALLKAVSDTVDVISGKIASDADADRPERVLVVVQTDGEENASNNGWAPQLSRKVEFNAPNFNPPEPVKEEPPYTKAKLKAKLEALHGWEVIYLGADMNAFADGASMGATRSIQYNSTPKGTTALYAAVTETATKYRSMGFVDADAQAALDNLKNKK